MERFSTKLFIVHRRCNFRRGNCTLSILSFPQGFSIRFTTEECSIFYSLAVNSLFYYILRFSIIFFFYTHQYTCLFFFNSSIVLGIFYFLKEIFFQILTRLRNLQKFIKFFFLIYDILRFVLIYFCISMINKKIIRKYNILYFLFNIFNFKKKYFYYFYIPIKNNNLLKFFYTYVYFIFISKSLQL